MSVCVLLLQVTFESLTSVWPWRFLLAIVYEDVLAPLDTWVSRTGEHRESSLSCTT